MQSGEIHDDAHGITTPRIYTPPLRPLTPETSDGWLVIEFAERFLHVHLYPWQKWLLIHGLETNPDGSYRFRRVVAEVARQNGKTTVMSVLCAWWLFVDSGRRPELSPSWKFLVVGAAQTLDNARAPYAAVLNWCNPTPQTDEEAALAVPALQKRVQRVNNSHGEEAIICRNKAQYIVRADKNIRSKSASRVVFDELREQHTDDGWNAVSQTTKAIWSSQLWGISNAGDYRSVVLRRVVDEGRRLSESWSASVETGRQSVDEWTEAHDASYGYFEWSAPDGCELDDLDGIRQANPSMGYGPMTYRSIIADINGMTEAAYRTEVLCQWVTADIIPFLDPKQWKRGIDKQSTIPFDNRVVLSVDTSADRETTYIAAAGYRADGLPHVELIMRRDGMLWVPKYLGLLREHHRDRHPVERLPGRRLLRPAERGRLDRASHRRLQGGCLHRQVQGPCQGRQAQASAATRHRTAGERGHHQTARRGRGMGQAEKRHAHQRPHRRKPGALRIGNHDRRRGETTAQRLRQRDRPRAARSLKGG